MNVLNSFIYNKYTDHFYYFPSCMAPYRKGKRKKGKGGGERILKRMSFIVKYRICVNAVWLNSNNDLSKKNPSSFLLLIRFFLHVIDCQAFKFNISYFPTGNICTIWYRVLYGFRIIQGKQFSAKRDVRRSTFMQIVIQVFKNMLPGKKKNPHNVYKENIAQMAIWYCILYASFM